MTEMTTLQTVAPEDLGWWLETVPKLEWIFAKTYAETAPHSYVVLGRTAGLTREDFRRAAHAIHTFGAPAKYYDSTNIYLEDPVSGKKWWTMDEKLDDTDLINMAEVSQVYGTQNAPDTRSDDWHEYDAVATRWDGIRDDSHDAAVKRKIRDHFGAYAPRTLDVGCGTGALLDMGLVSPYLYTGIDPSQGMLNALVRKYPKVQRVLPWTLERAIKRPRGTKLPTYELVVAMDVPIFNHAILASLVAPGGLLITTGESAQ